MKVKFIIEKGNIGTDGYSVDINGAEIINPIDEQLNQQKL